MELPNTIVKLLINHYMLSNAFRGNDKLIFLQILIKVRNFILHFKEYLVFYWNYNSNFIIELDFFENIALINLRFETLCHQTPRNME